MTFEDNTIEGSPVETLKNVKWTQSGLLPSADPSKAGYSFAGWFSDEELTSSVVAATKYCDIAVTEKASITLYAKWTEKTTYKVNYNAKGGSPTPPAMKNVAWTKANLLPATTPVLAGYELVG